MTDSSQSPEQPDNRFDRLAATWDENPVRVRMARAVAQKMAERINPEASMDALEFGCGTGLVTILMAPSLGRLTALDSSANMLTELQRKSADLGLSNLSFINADVDKADIPGGPYHLIFSNMTLHHVENSDALLKKIQDALKPGGILAITDLDLEDGSFHGDMPGVYHTGFKRGDVVSAFEKAGFVHCTVEDAHVVEKPGKNGGIKPYPMFLATGRKPD